MSSAERLATEAKSVFDAADQQNRPLTTDERVYVEDLLTRAEQARDVEGRVKAFGLNIGGHGVSATDPNVVRGGQRPGDAIVASRQYKAIQNPATRGQRWTTGAIELETKDLFEGANQDLGSGAAGAGAPLVPIDQRPGIQ